MLIEVQRVNTWGPELRALEVRVKGVRPRQDEREARDVGAALSDRRAGVGEHDTAKPAT